MSSVWLEQKYIELQLKFDEDIFSLSGGEGFEAPLMTWQFHQKMSAI